jgi:hypothetical protein
MRVYIIVGFASTHAALDLATLAPISYGRSSVSPVLILPAPMSV